MKCEELLSLLLLPVIIQTEFQKKGFCAWLKPGLEEELSTAKADAALVPPDEDVDGQENLLVVVLSQRCPVESASNCEQ